MHVKRDREGWGIVQKEGLRTPLGISVLQKAFEHSEFLADHYFFSVLAAFIHDVHFNVMENVNLLKY